MSGINLHTILGRIGKVETRYTADGKAIVNMSLAVSENWTDKNSGQKQEKTEWLRVVIFGKPAEIIGQYAEKGDRIYVQGKVVTRKYTDTAGIEKYTTETVVDGFNGRFELLGCKSNQQSQQQNNQGQSDNNQQTQNKPQQGYQQQNNQNQAVQQQSNQQTNGGTADGFGDDIPFIEHERFLL